MYIPGLFRTASKPLSTFIESEEYEKHDNKEAEFLQESIIELDQEFRSIIILREIQELSYEEISKIVDVPLGTVKSRINRARLQLQKELKDFKKGDTI